MNGPETQRAAAAERRYQRSKQARIDREIDRAKRRMADLTAGHHPNCTLTKCVPSCKR